jgi:V/A-type H+/Na+-transporting ATPase subunit I
MAIVKLKKVTIFGLAHQRDEVLDGLQQLGCLHLIDLPGHSGTQPFDHCDRTLVNSAIQFLQSCPVQNANQQTLYSAGLNCLGLARIAIENRDRRDALNDELDHLKHAIEKVEPWGEFEVPDSGTIQGLYLWFYVVPLHQLDELKKKTEAWQLINQDQQNAYIVVVSPDEPDVSWVAQDLDPRPLSVLRRRLREVNEELETLHWDRVFMTRWLNLLQKDLDHADDEVSRLEAISRMFQDQQLFALQAWAPQKTLPALDAFAQKQKLAISVANPGTDETPPTLLKNPEAVAGAEGVVTFYMTPAYRAWDPTWIMYASFTFFFAMIMSDAAYGMVLGLGLLLVWRRMGTEKLRSFRYLLLALVLATIGYGVIAGSYFGVTPSWLERFQLKFKGQPIVADKDVMMIVSLMIGVVHLAIANLITAWRNLGRSYALSSVGWAIALVGGLTLGLFAQDTNLVPVTLGEWWNRSPDSFQPTMKQLGLISTIGGMVMVFLFSSTRPLFSAKASDWAWRLLDGFLGLTNVSKAFGDTLSYLRLFALGLASAQLAMTFNNLALGVSEVPGLGFLFALLILVIGHGVNILLGIMSGVVHGLRLNCIEFFNWSLTEEGYPFQAFNKKAG